jgi:hypothetical protein
MRGEKLGVSIIRSLSVLCAEVKNGEAILPISYVLMVWCLINSTQGQFQLASLCADKA